MSLSTQLNNFYAFCKANVPQFNISPGTVLNDLLSAVAAVVASYEATFNNGIQGAFVSTAVGSALDALGLDRGVSRTGASNASGTLIFTRADTSGVLSLPAGVIVSTVNLDPTTNVNFSTLSPATFNAGVASVSVSAVCSTAGSLGNIGAGTISNIVSVAPGVTAVTNPTAMTGGTDSESDASFRVRIWQTLTPQNSVTRINGAVLGVSGIFSAATFDQQDGLGNFIVYACDQSGALAVPLKTTVQSAADGSKSLGTVGTVYTPTVTPINVAYNFAPQTNFVAATVQSDINSVIRAYFGSLVIGQTIRPYDITSRVIGNVSGFSAVSGVLDFQLTSPSAYQIALPWQLYTLGAIAATQIAA